MSKITQIVRNVEPLTEYMGTSDHVELGHAERTLALTRRIEVNKKKLRARKIYIDADDKKSAVAISAYKHLRTQTLGALSESGVRSLIVTGPTKGVGKSVTAINLAISIARHRERTAMLVDLDLRAPSLHRYFQFEPRRDIVDVAKGTCTLKNILVCPGVSRLTLLPGNRSYENSSELLTWAPVQSIIREITQRYCDRILIFDLPPVLGCDDVPAIAPAMDACLLVVEESVTSRYELAEAQRRLGNTKLLGTVLNKSRRDEFARYYY